MDNQVIKKDNDTKKISTLIVLILTLMFCTTSATYAYLAFSATSNNMTGAIASSGLELTVTPADLQTTNTGFMVPQKESALGTAMNSTNKCVDGNKNIVCRVYTINVKLKDTQNVIDTATTGTISFAFTKQASNLKWRLASSTTTLGSAGSTQTASTSAATFAAPSFTSANNNFTYYIVVWLNETNAVQADSGDWTATIEFKNSSGSITSTIK